MATRCRKNTFAILGCPYVLPTDQDVVQERSKCPLSMLTFRSISKPLLHLRESRGCIFYASCKPMGLHQQLMPRSLLQRWTDSFAKILLPLHLLQLVRERAPCQTTSSFLQVVIWYPYLDGIGRRCTSNSPFNKMQIC